MYVHVAILLSTFNKTKHMEGGAIPLITPSLRLWYASGPLFNETDFTVDDETKKLLLQERGTFTKNLIMYVAGG